MVIAVEAHRIAYMALPKAGCTTVKTALAQIDPAVRQQGAPDTANVHALYPTRRFRPHRWQGYAGYWRFCVVREPLQRLLSVYTNRVVELGELHNSRRLRRARPDLPCDPDPDFFFRNLAGYRDMASVIRHHVLPAWLFLGPDLDRYDRIYTTGTLDQLASDLALRSGAQVTMPRANASARRLAPESLKPETLAALGAHLAPEYEYLNAFFPNPFKPGGRFSCAASLRRVS
ncbi:sulfotransferase family 2 domain-containing protein [Salipiger mangrovisoli]|uniref:Sulfotransferase family 2 domain-containing protein n=1 Tax=Salipiger mangrovisoli TaxID=2865933 RepID=A0ABR9WWM9_9RHOB|nr:sulfotransferase family 2 domain-containing protein [Salipiger mangrovisoli]MBE9635655.1 sulfotransferase family 2 domain-containing protein [Salipiger mangrovisoli]